MRIFMSVVFLLLIITGCGTEKADTDAKEWSVSPAFKAGARTLYGNEGKFGILRENGEGNNLFNVGLGRLYGLYFWGNPEQLKGKYKLLGIHKETNEKVQLYEWDIQKGQNPAQSDAFSGGKFGLNQPGLWRLDVYIGDKFFDSIVVEVK